MPMYFAYQFYAVPSFSNRSNRQTDLSLRFRTDAVNCQVIDVYDFHHSRSNRSVLAGHLSNRFVSDEGRQPAHLASRDSLVKFSHDAHHPCKSVRFSAARPNQSKKVSLCRKFEIEITVFHPSYFKSYFVLSYPRHSQLQCLSAIQDLAILILHDISRSIRTLRSCVDRRR